MSTILPYLMVLFLAIWTARTAMSRGRNPWLWGAGALLLGILPALGIPSSKLLAVIPLALMLFLPRFGSQAPVRPQRLACQRCAQSLRPDQHFCTNCGWDISQAYTPDGTETFGAAVTERPQEPARAPQVETPLGAPAEQPLETPVEPVFAQTTEATSSGVEIAAEQSPQPRPEGVLAQEAAPEAVLTAEVSTAEVPTAEAVAGASPKIEATGEETGAAEESPKPVDDAPQVPAQPWGLPEPKPAPTAANMTARGARLFNDGRIQEAIDQFTKAIALDPGYGEAFERRAEAYTKQGRGEHADRDRRHLQGLNASSSPS